MVRSRQAHNLNAWFQIPAASIALLAQGRLAGKQRVAAICKLLVLCYRFVKTCQPFGPNWAEKPALGSGAR